MITINVNFRGKKYEVCPKWTLMQQMCHLGAKVELTANDPYPTFMVSFGPSTYFLFNENGDQVHTMVGVCSAHAFNEVDDVRKYIKTSNEETNNNYDNVEKLLDCISDQIDEDPLEAQAMDLYIAMLKNKLCNVDFNPSFIGEDIQVVKDYVEHQSQGWWDAAPVTRWGKDMLSKIKNKKQ